MICLKLATRTGSFQVEADATPADCGVANINYERKPLAVPGTRNNGTNYTNYADSRYQLPQIDILSSPAQDLRARAMNSVPPSIRIALGRLPCSSGARSRCSTTNTESIFLSTVKAVCLRVCPSILLKISSVVPCPMESNWSSNPLTSFGYRPAATSRRL